ncbi:hypothetical protein GRX03_02060 [Halovenus sp. WSH3]|uniref:DUF7981 domain-containing protein n=1 Tax=Halovenus carboxidivorans TaxID=2692199 RepID=A0A6B0T4G5_9EURY|nr:hypothetical protein [Halovenus carboxidivorans]MXR50393.1 hypothetical protein [Halovenus carboxidivorans]
MEPQVKSSLLWGVTGTLTFIVVLQAYYLLTEARLRIELVLAVAVAVGIVTAVLSYLLRPWVRTRAQRFRNDRS